MSGRIFPLLLCVTGATGAVVALGIDVVLNGSPGFGYAQMGLLLVSLGAFSIGLDTKPAELRDAIRGVLASPRDHLGALGKYAAILLQLVLMLVVVRQFQIESTSFYDRIALLIVGGFAVHYLLPARSRLVFFALLSLSAVWIVFGVEGAPWLIGIGLGLIALCHLPISFRARVLLLVAAAVVLAALRAEWWLPPFPSAIWPILGSMFMFRLIVYMYDLRHSKERVDWRQSLAYFFLLPNVVFPLFPVVDWSTFRRTYYDRDRHWIYQRGVQWIFRGITHLLVYRLVYQAMLITPEQVATPLDLGRFMVSTFLLYLRVSGQFHLIIGLLHLFGFRLPETHNLFYLSSSFTDFWRRINIYWKDFMMKVVFYPSLFRLKRFGQTTRIVMATLAVFAATWALHAVQWFWLLGEFLMTWPDVLFWTILAVLLIVNSLYEMRHGRKRTLAGQRLSLSSLMPRAVSTAATFVAICILWSFWSSHSVDEWVSLWGVLGEADGGGWQFTGILGLGVIGLGMVASSGSRIPSPTPEASGRAARETSFSGVVLRTLIAAGLMVAIGSPSIASRLGGTVGGALRDLRTPYLSMADQETMRRGYYENLTAPNPLNAALFDVYSGRASQIAWPNIREAGLARLTGDALHWELLPLRATMYHGALLRTNQWGMRDQHYEREKPPHTYRIAVLGASYVMGDGVADHETFEAVLEDRLAAERSPGDANVEILNFATPNYMPIQHLVQLHRRVLDFDPDAAFLVSHASDAMDVRHVLTNYPDELNREPLSFLRPLLDSLGADPTAPKAEFSEQLLPHSYLLIERVYTQFVADCRERGVVPVWVHVPTPNIEPTDERIDQLAGVAERAGFVVVDLRHVYADIDPRSLWIADWDYHPNAAGHHRIADQLHGMLLSPQSLIPLPRTQPAVQAVPVADSVVAPTPAAPPPAPVDRGTLK